MTLRPCLKHTAVVVIAWVAVGEPSRSATAQELLGYWQFAETDVNQDAIDSSGNGLNGTYEGDVDPNVEGAPGFGSGANFDGISGQILIGPGDENGLGDLTSGFSVMAWINPDQFDHKNRVFGSSPWAAGSGWGWGTNGDQLEITTWGVKDYTQPVPLQLEEWTHAAVVLDANFEAHFYVNGEFVGTQTHPEGGGPTVNGFYIGFACCDAEHFEGRLDEIGVFSGTLAADQIQNAMNLGVNNFNGLPPGVAGDFNDDGTVDGADFALMTENFNSTFPREESYSKGDFDQNTRVDLNDFIEFRAVFNGNGAAAAAVPEPCGFGLSLLAGGWLLMAGTRRRH